MADTDGRCDSGIKTIDIETVIRDYIDVDDMSLDMYTI